MSNTRSEDSIVPFIVILPSNEIVEFLPTHSTKITARYNARILQAYQDLDSEAYGWIISELGKRSRLSLTTWIKSKHEFLYLIDEVVVVPKPVPSPKAPVPLPAHLQKK